MSPKVIGNYTLAATLGEGSFGKVKCAKDNRDNQHYAIKMVSKTKVLSKPRGAEALQKEASPIALSGHLCVVRFWRANLYMSTSRPPANELPSETSGSSSPDAVNRSRRWTCSS